MSRPRVSQSAEVPSGESAGLSHAYERIARETYAAIPKPGTTRRKTVSLGGVRLKTSQRTTPTAHDPDGQG